MMMAGNRWLLALIVCNASPAHGDRMDAKMLDNLDLTWSMSRQEGKLRIAYEVTNRSAQRVYLVDDMLVFGTTKFTRATNAIIVRQGPSPDVASFYRGDLDIPTHEMRRYPAPGMREILPGAKLAGTAETPLPLAAWHPYHPDKMPKLTGTPTKAVLELRVLGEKGTYDKDWINVALEEGGEVPSPSFKVLRERGKILKSDVKAIP